MKSFWNIVRYSIMWILLAGLAFILWGCKKVSTEEARTAGTFWASELPDGTACQYHVLLTELADQENMNSDIYMCVAERK